MQMFCTSNRFLGEVIPAYFSTTVMLCQQLKRVCCVLKYGHCKGHEQVHRKTGYPLTAGSAGWAALRVYSHNGRKDIIQINESVIDDAYPRINICYFVCAASPSGEEAKMYPEMIRLDCRRDWDAQK